MPHQFSCPNCLPGGFICMAVLSPEALLLQLVSFSVSSTLLRPGQGGGIVPGHNPACQWLPKATEGMLLPCSLTHTQAQPRATHLVSKCMMGPEDTSSSPLHSDFLHHLTSPHHPRSYCTLFPSRGTKDHKRADNPHPVNGGKSRKEE